MIEQPSLLLSPTVLLLCSYWSLDFDNTFKAFFSYWFALECLAQVAAAVGYLQSSMWSKMETATTTANIFTMPFILFGGFFSNPNTYPKVVSWMQYISPIK